MNQNVWIRSEPDQRERTDRPTADQISLRCSGSSFFIRCPLCVVWHSGLSRSMRASLFEKKKFRSVCEEAASCVIATSDSLASAERFSVETKLCVPSALSLFVRKSEF